MLEMAKKQAKTMQKIFKKFIHPYSLQCYLQRPDLENKCPMTCVEKETVT